MNSDNSVCQQEIHHQQTATHCTKQEKERIREELITQAKTLIVRAASEKWLPVDLRHVVGEHINPLRYLAKCSADLSPTLNQVFMMSLPTP